MNDDTQLWDKEISQWQPLLTTIIIIFHIQSILHETGF